MLPTKKELRQFPVLAPLFAAVFAPLSTLLDIPALTEPWFFQEHPDGLLKLPDPAPNLALSAIGLTFNVLANGLLIARFSSGERGWQLATKLSMGCWTIKFAIALGNVLAYGILTRNKPTISYGEGFWCAVVSLIVSFFILLLLLCHYIFQFLPNRGTSSSVSQLQVRVAGRQFMFQTQFFVATIGILALYMSRLEGWTYLQGVYFSIVSFTTVGFGDFYPTKPATQIVLFPFLLVGIIQLASLIDMIVRFFSSRISSRHAKHRAEFERKRQEQEAHQGMEPNLKRELSFLRNLYATTNKRKTTEDLVINVLGFLVFWVIGALIFSHTESWTYGEGLYFCYPLFFTLGYGDYAPTSPAGRVIFIVYSILAVPVMASFAVQTIQNVLKTTLNRRMHKRRTQAGLDIEFDERDGKYHFGKDKKTKRTSQSTNATLKDGGIAESAPKEGESRMVQEDKQLPEDARRRIEHTLRDWDKPHGFYVAKSHRRIEERLKTAASQSRNESKLALADTNHVDSASTQDTDAEAEKEADAEERRTVELAEHEVDRMLTEYVLELAVELEKHARRLLLAHMPEGSNARMLLKADRIVQLRNIRALAEQEVGYDDAPRGRTDEKQDGVDNAGHPINALMRKYYEQETELLPAPTDLSERETLEEVTRYRESFAGLLAAGSRLLGLKDEEQQLFERRLKEIEVSDEDDDGLRRQQ